MEYGSTSHGIIELNASNADRTTDSDHIYSYPASTLQGRCTLPLLFLSRLQRPWQPPLRIRPGRPPHETMHLPRCRLSVEALSCPRRTGKSGCQHRTAVLGRFCDCPSGVVSSSTIKTHKFFHGTVHPVRRRSTKAVVVPTQFPVSTRFSIVS